MSAATSVVSRCPCDAGGVAKALAVAASASDQRGDRVQAKAFADEAAGLFRQVDDKRGLALLIANLGYTALEDGDLESARRLTRQAVPMQRELGHTEGLAISLQNLALIELVKGRHEQAIPLLEEALALAEESGYALSVIYCLEGIARVAAVRGEVAQAARLLGATETALESIGAMREEAETASRRSTLATVRDRLDKATFEAVTDEGRVMPLAEATAEGRRLVASLHALPSDLGTGS
jgi:tetratricopeptide (TPR) repeat protein